MVHCCKKKKGGKKMTWGLYSRSVLILSEVGGMQVCQYFRWTKASFHWGRIVWMERWNLSLQALMNTRWWGIISQPVGYTVWSILAALIVINLVQRFRYPFKGQAGLLWVSLWCPFLSLQMHLKNQTKPHIYFLEHLMFSCFLSGMLKMSENGFS